MSASTVSVSAVGAASSLVSVSVVPVTVTPVSVPAMLMVSSSSGRASSVGVSVKSTKALAVLAAMVRLWSGTSV